MLSFKNQKSGWAGMLVTSNGFVLEDVGFEDTRGDGIKVNGAYGLYPVQCKYVLIEDSMVRGKGSVIAA